MKIIEMSRFTAKGEPICIDPINDCYEDVHDWWCVLETKEEAEALADFEKHLGEYDGDMRDVEWNKRMIEAGKDFGLCWGDDDVYGYLMPDEYHPKIGEETIDSDGDTWIRTK